MIFGIFLSISLLVSIGVRFRYIKESLAAFILIAIYATSLLPSLQIPYIIDDMDHLFLLATSIEASKVTQWIFTPHNEHAIPFLKLLYFLFYENFWLHPQPFHLVIIGICTGILCLSYCLLSRLTQSKFAAFLGIALLASTNLPDLASFVITNSHIIFCLFFILLLFFAQYQYLATNKRKIWAFLIILSTVIAPSTFSLGTTALAFAFLFEWLCIPKALKRLNGSTMLIVAIGWIIGLFPYLLTFDKIIHAEHYAHLGASSAFEVMNIVEGLRLLLLYCAVDLIPGLLPNLYFSIGLFFFAVSAAIKYRKCVNWKCVVFFLFSGFAFNLIIYVFRAGWGPLYLSVSRYDVFPSLMLCITYIILITPFLKEHEVLIKNPNYKFVILLVAFIFVSYGGTHRYTRAMHVAIETDAAVQEFNVEFKDSIVTYFVNNPNMQKLILKDPVLFTPNLPSLLTKKGFGITLSRYPRKLSFYAQYVLPLHVRHNVAFGKSTDPAFLNYLKHPDRKDTYRVMISLLE